MKKLLSVVIALMMMVTFVFAEEAAPAEVKTLYAGVLTVGCEAGYPPFEMVANPLSVWTWTSWRLWRKSWACRCRL